MLLIDIEHLASAWILSRRLIQTVSFAQQLITLNWMKLRQLSLTGMLRFKISLD